MSTADDFNKVAALKIAAIAAVKAELIAAGFGTEPGFPMEAQDFIDWANIIAFEEFDMEEGRILALRSYYLRRHLERDRYGLLTQTEEIRFQAWLNADRAATEEKP